MEKNTKIILLLTIILGLILLFCFFIKFVPEVLYLLPYIVFVMIPIIIFSYLGLRKYKPEPIFQENKMDKTGFEEAYGKITSDFEWELKGLKNKIRILQILQILLLAIFIFGLFISESEIEIFSEDFSAFLIVSALPALVIYIVVMGQQNKLKKEHKEIYKDYIIPEVLRLIDGTLEYSYIAIDAEKIQMEYAHAEFAADEYDDFFVDDYIEGKLNNGKAIEIADTRVVGYDLEDRPMTVFKGIFVAVESVTYVDGIIEIVTQKTRAPYGLSKLEINDEKFKKLFKAYTNNEILAKIILHSKLIDKLIEIKEEYEVDCEIVFRGAKMYLRIDSDKGLFENTIWGDAIEAKVTESYYGVVKTVLNIVDEINELLPTLNTEI